MWNILLDHSFWVEFIPINQVVVIGKGNPTWENRPIMLDLYWGCETFAQVKRERQVNRTRLNCTYLLQCTVQYTPVYELHLKQLMYSYVAIVRLCSTVRVLFSCGSDNTEKPSVFCFFSRDAFVHRKKIRPMWTTRVAGREYAVLASLNAYNVRKERHCQGRGRPWN